MAGEEVLKYQVERLLDGVDALIYLLDYTKLKVRPRLGKHIWLLHSRCIAMQLPVDFY